jgi:hypothetical protein
MAVEEGEAAPPQVSQAAVSNVTGTSATLEAEVNPGGKLTRYHFEYGTADCATSSCTSIPLLEAEISPVGSPVHVEVMLEGLAPGTVHHFLASAKNGEGGTVKSPDKVFATRGTPAGSLPDGRAYEQASPVGKDGGDATGKVALVKAADDGSGITFNSTFGIPGGGGAQTLPTYLATRGSSWATQGLLPPPAFGERATVQGWLPGFSETVSNAVKLKGRLKALVLQSTTDGPATVIAPYTFKAEYSYVGASADASTFFFESQAKLPPAEGENPIEAAIEGKPNLYAWDRASGRLSLAGVMNDEKAPPKGALAGPYDWSAGISPKTLREGGAARGYYLEGIHAITAQGDIYFTEAGTGQLYLRLNPTQPQSTVVGEKCTEEAKACTVHVSVSKRSTPDPAGAQPAALQAAGADGSVVFFTSPEKLTDDANTGPDQPAAAIGTGNITTGEIEEAAFIPKRAVGVAVDSEHVYWADPIAGTIGRADIDGSDPDDAFIAPGESECELEVETEPGVFEKEVVPAPSTPRYVAVDAGHVYWTNTGVLDKNGESIDKGGTVGRADLDGETASVDPDFICGASNPQGIAVNATHIYWANAGKDVTTIARSATDGAATEQSFLKVTGSLVPSGVALSASHVYFSDNEIGNENSSIRRILLDGGEEEHLFIGKVVLRGVAVDSAHVYWASQGEEAIGRANLALEPASQENTFVKEIEGKLFGLAADASHIYWSVNGESPSNPGSDLYRYEPGTDTLTDLASDPADANGAEVQGVLGTSEDGSRVYFAANGDLDGGGEAAKGDCQTSPAHGSLTTLSGSCSIYLWNGGIIVFVGRTAGSIAALNWVGTPRELFSTAGFAPKTAFTSKDGETLLFRSQERLADYDNEGVPELYRFHVGDTALRCVSCPPGGEAAGKGPSMGSVGFPGEVAPALASVNMTAARNLSSDGNRAFFESAEALVPEDTNGLNCPGLGIQGTPACLDVYEWEAPGTGTCSKGGEGYSPLNEGCIYLLSTGKSPFPSFFADASESGSDVFFFTRQGLVAQDTDELQDVYDARVGGGIPSQNQVPPEPCLGAEACHGPVGPAPPRAAPVTPGFAGPGNPAAKHKKQGNAKKPKAKKHKAKKKHKGRKRANSKRGQAGV